MSAPQSASRSGGESSWLGLRPATLLMLVAIAVLLVPLSALSLRLPDNFDGSLILESLRLCRMLTPPAVHRTRCSEPLPARVARPSVQEVRIIPETPLAGTDTYGLSLMLFNPSVPGRYPLRLYAASPAAPQPTYRGTWLIRISAEQD